MSPVKWPHVSERTLTVIRWAVILKLLVGAAALALWIASAGCALFPTQVDPCPLPPEQHPEAWSAVPMGYVCGGPGVKATEP